MVEAVKQNFPQREIADAALRAPAGDRRRAAHRRRRQRAHRGRRRRRRRSCSIDPALERKQIGRVQAVRARRDARGGRGRARRPAAKAAATRRQPHAAPARRRAGPRHRGRDRPGAPAASGATTPRRRSSEAASTGPHRSKLLAAARRRAASPARRCSPSRRCARHEVGRRSRTTYFSPRKSSPCRRAPRVQLRLAPASCRTTSSSRAGRRSSTRPLQTKGTVHGQAVTTRTGTYTHHLHDPPGR